MNTQNATTDLPTPAELAASGSVADLHRWMAEATETQARADRALNTLVTQAARDLWREEKDEARAVWLACRDELDRRNHAQVSP